MIRKDEEEFSEKDRLRERLPTGMGSGVRNFQVRRRRAEEEKTGGGDRKKNSSRINGTHEKCKTDSEEGKVQISEGCKGHRGRPYLT